MTRHYLLVELPEGTDPAPGEVLETISTALAQAGYGEESDVTVYDSALALARDDPEQAELRDAHMGDIDTARRLYADDELEIDDYPNVAPGGEDGTWVSAWVWVPADNSED